MPKNILNYNLTGSPGFFFLSESGDLSKGGHNEPGTGGPEDLCTGTFCSLSCFLLLFTCLWPKNRVSARHGVPKLSLALLTQGISLHFNPAPQLLDWMVREGLCVS